jgi:uncharacterized protein YfiM (DUF2279 family)
MPLLIVVVLLVVACSAAVYGHWRGRVYARREFRAAVSRAAGSIVGEISSPAEMRALNRFLAELENAANTS